MDLILPLLLQCTCEGLPLRYDKEDGWYMMDSKKIPIELVKGKKTRRFLSKSAIKYFDNGTLGSRNPELATALCCGEEGDDIREQIMALGNRALQATTLEWQSDPWLCQLDWTLSPKERPTSKTKKPKKPKPPPVIWPKWYWDAAAPKKDLPPGTLQVTVRTRVAPLLLRLSWSGHPLFHSREHGWTFRVPANSNFQTRTKPVKFYDPS
jgi:DNA polymerase gamma 1